MTLHRIKDGWPHQCSTSGQGIARPVEIFTQGLVAISPIAGEQD
jgi:hypothetical protein